MQKQHIVARADTIQDVRRLADDFCQHHYQNVLIVLDLDLTLVKPIHPAVSFASLEKYRETFEDLIKDFSNEQTDELFNIALGGAPIMGMEPETLETFHYFSAAGANLLGLTASLSGRLFYHERFETFRLQQCAALGFQFPHICSSPDFSLDLPPFRGNKPVYYHGIIFANGVRHATTKGDVLTFFLEKEGMTPEKIIFVDDIKENVDSVSERLSQKYAALPHLSLEYTRCQADPYISSEKDFENYWRHYAALIEPVAKKN
ncbi:hypothetical protein AGMMS49949_06580 [Alphaproteobacteria bacterium]|nr:hypothetical protein AGMMS49949_06580 [Alphaproteobacteria bacterium]GHS96936.1 hypothetical protein AGMMS50296_3470 [Alphaproteobacteria bacterium]